MARVAAGRWLLASIVAVAAVHILACPVRAGVLDSTWNAPTTNADGSPVTGVASYRIYYGTSNPPCPASSFLAVPSISSAPAPDTVVNERERRAPGCRVRGTDACDRWGRHVVHRAGGRACVAGCICRGDGEDVRAGLEDDAAGNPVGRPVRRAAATLAVAPAHLGHALIVGGRSREGLRVAAGARDGIGGRGDGHSGRSRIRRVGSRDTTSKTRAGTLIAASVYSGHLN